MFGCGNPNAGCVCVYVLYFLSHCMQPEGLWQRLAAAPTDSAPILPPLLHTTIQIPSPTTCALYRGYPISFPPWPPDPNAGSAQSFEFSWCVERDDLAHSACLPAGWCHPLTSRLNLSCRVGHSAATRLTFTVALSRTARASSPRRVQLRDLRQGAAGYRQHRTLDSPNPKSPTLARATMALPCTAETHGVAGAEPTLLAENPLPPGAQPPPTAPQNLQAAPLEIPQAAAPDAAKRDYTDSPHHRSTNRSHEAARRAEPAFVGG